MQQSQSEFVCQSCFYVHNADHVGIMNVEAAGLAVMPCEVNSNRSRQQEPLGRGGCQSDDLATELDQTNDNTRAIGMHCLTAGFG